MFQAISAPAPQYPPQQATDMLGEPAVHPLRLLVYNLDPPLCKGPKDSATDYTAFSHLKHRIFFLKSEMKRWTTPKCSHQKRKRY